MLGTHDGGVRSARALLMAGLVAAAAAAAPGVAGAAVVKPGAQAFSLDGPDLITYALDDPSAPKARVAVTGIQSGDALVGVAVRPQTADLYAVGVDEAARTLRLYHLAASTGHAAPVGAATSLTDAAGGTTVLDAAGAWGVAFNPSADRVRVTGPGSINARLNPNTGGLVDGDLGGSAPLTGPNADGPINGATTSVDATGYTNRTQLTTVTTQYTLSSATDALHVQSPPNSGTQGAGIPLKRGGAPLDIASAKGLDFLPEVAAPATNAAATGQAYAALRIGDTTQLAKLDLTSGDVRTIGAIAGGGTGVRGLAIQALEVDDRLHAIPAVALTVGSGLKRFNTAAPGTAVGVALGAPVAGETIVAITRRPQTGQHLALGIDAAADTGTAYVLDPQLGSLTPIAPSGIALAKADASPVDLPAGAQWGFDVNPTSDRLRVVSSTGLNFRVHPDTGAALDGDFGTGVPTSGTNPDGPQSGLAGGSSGVSATAYTNAFGRDLSAPAGPTTQFTLDAPSGSLYVQNPPNSGTQTAALRVAPNYQPLAFAPRVGFDIPSSVAVAAPNAPATASDYGYAALTAGGESAIYLLGLREAAVPAPLAGGAPAPGFAGTAPALKLGVVAANEPIDALALGEQPPAAVVSATPAAALPGPAPAPGPVPPKAVDPAPVLKDLAIVKRSFRTGKRPKGAAKRYPTGTRLTFSLSEPSTVTFTLERGRAGRRSGKTCQKPSSRNRKGKSCTRYAAAGSFTAKGIAGKNIVAFNGKLGRKSLARAKYRLRAVATDAAGQRSAVSPARAFTIVR